MTQTGAKPSTEQYNFVRLRGRLGKSPQRASDSAPVVFDLAVWQGKDREKMWLTVNCWDELGTAVLANDNIYKGVKVDVCGRLTCELYHGKRIYAIAASSVEVVKL
jgi:single-stranded DNA-binding protein